MTISFDINKARNALNQAKLALKLAEERFDAGRYIAEIKQAEWRVAVAESVLHKLEPGETD